MKKADLHIHTIHSDGSDSVSALLEKIEETKLAVFSVTDHDTLLGTEAILSSPSLPARFIPGVEFTCMGEGGKSHILGYGFDPSHGAMQTLTEDARARRLRKLNLRLTHLKKEHGIAFTPEEEAWLYSLNAAGKPHLASLLISHGYAVNKQEAIDRYLSRVPGGDDRTDTQKAIDTIHQAGGLAVFAHPLGGEGETRLSTSAFTNKLSRLLSMGIDGLECAYSLYSRTERDFLASAARRHALLISGGSDYHGTNKTIPLGQLSSDNSDPPASDLTLLRHFDL